MGNREIVITGVSAVASIGSSPEEIFSSLLNEKTNHEKIPFESEYFKTKQIAFVKNFNPEDYIDDSKILRFMSKEARLSLAAFKLCLMDSDVIPGKTHAEEELALFAGTGTSGIEFSYIENLINNSSNEETGRFDPIRFGEVALKRLNPLTSFKILPNMAPSVSAINTNIKGSNLIFNPWEGSALLALNEAYYEIISGRQKMIFCGGSDCKTHSDAFVSFDEFGIFDNSDIVLSEGSAYLCVEDYDDAVRRGAKIYCKIKGITHFSSNSEDICSYSFSEKLYFDMINNSLEESGLKADEIDLIFDSNDHNHRNDECENAAINVIFDDPLRISLKKIAGNSFAAAGYMSLASASFILNNDLKINNREINTILINSFSIGSEKFCIVLESH